MTLLQVEAVWKGHAGQAVLRGVSLAVPAGAIVAVLGASGCGKTTLLRLIAGFDEVESGRIVLGGRVLAEAGRHVPAEQRHIGYVPQEGTLFPHLTVADNVGFGLSRAERRAGRATEAMALTGLSGLERRYPHQISGGQQQRTALARALAPRPALILLDEPFAALDLALRRSVCADVVAVLRRNQATAILVTHDPEEAFASADLVVVMRDGLAVQCAAAETVYRQPADLGVAHLTGGTILLEGSMRDGCVETALGRLAVQPGAPACGAVQAMLRPEQIVLSADGIPARVLSTVFRGDHSVVTVQAGGVRLELRLALSEASPDVIGLRVVGACVVF